MYSRTSRSSARALVVALALGGCSMQPIVAEHAVEYNRAIEKVKNQLVFLNILRAKDGMPMHFTNISQVRGNLSASATASGTIPFGRNTLNPFVFSPSAEAQTNPSFDINNLDSQEFTRGILRPVNMTIVDYYWQQGWPKQLLLHMFIERIEFYRSNGPGGGVRLLHITENDPSSSNPAKLTDFQAALRYLKLWVASKPGSNIGPRLNAGQLSGVAALQKQGIRLASSSGGTRFQLKSSSSFVFCLSRIANEDERPSSAVECDNTRASIAQPGPNVSAGKKYLPSEFEDKPRNRKFDYDKEIGNEDDVIIYLRSAQGMLYYLGEISRSYERSKRDPATPIYIEPKLRWIGSQGRPQADVLFFAASSEDIGSADGLSVEYRGRTYVIPDDVPGVRSNIGNRSFQALALVSQILGLQKQAKELPTTSAVTVTGP